MTGFTPAPGVRYAGTDDGAMLLDLSAGKFFGLNPTAATMWRFLACGTSPEETALRLASDLGVSAEQLVEDVRSLTAALLDRGLLSEEVSAP
ncbi:PqqD family peptide modification chaperone [Nocardiopsis algeriensis]|uniref:Coenzyme PQQ synthesis protein D (PqqD) n=1 Tax=Nocardiopsis algeriensis TaxID=1478215 RepID=A0A841IVB1_9ACTN|nr:PqqD family peptide modification chaperone [Nocardiopsis algeriensis]MBB6122274.1 hypothetical protein [Nocardiopsis algeriensis]